MKKFESFFNRRIPLASPSWNFLGGRSSLGCWENCLAIKMRIILLAGLLAISGCNVSNDFHVTAYRTVEGAEAAPWPTGCLVTAENRTQRIIGMYGLPCDKIQVGNNAVFNHP